MNWDKDKAGGQGVLIKRRWPRPRTCGDCENPLSSDAVAMFETVEREEERPPKKGVPRRSNRLRSGNSVGKLASPRNAPKKLAKAARAPHSNRWCVCVMKFGIQTNQMLSAPMATRGNSEQY